MTAARRILLAAQLDGQDLMRRPLILVLLTVTPFFFISRAIASTEPLPRTVSLAGGSTVTTTMRAVHGADMTAIAVAFLAGLVGVFIMTSARQADGRLARAGFGATETVLARLSILVVCTLLVVIISLLTTARDFQPQHWGWFAVGNLLIGLTFAGLGALASGLFGRIGATYLLLFLAMLDLGIVQNPMFGDSTPPAWAVVLPGYAGTRTVMTAALSPHGGVPLGLVLGMTAWFVGVLSLTVWRLSVELRGTR